MNNNRLIRILLFLGLAAGVALALLYRDRFDAAALEAWVQEAGIAAPLLFMLIYALAAVLFLPGSVLTLAGGALFGPVLGTFYNLTGATLGATLAFLIARYLASDWVAKKAGGRVKQLINGVENEGWRFVAFVRLVPLFPFNLLNYALGLTRLKLQPLPPRHLCLHAARRHRLHLPGLRRPRGGRRRRRADPERRCWRWRCSRSWPSCRASSATCVAVPCSSLRISSGGSMPATVCWCSMCAPQTPLPVNRGTSTARSTSRWRSCRERMAELGDYLERPVAIVCRTDRMSAKAALLLTEEGFADVHVVRGGMTKWNEAGLPVKR